MSESNINKDMVTWFNTAEAAEYLSISKGQLLNLVSKGEIPYYKLGRSNRYRKEELDELLVSTRRFKNRSEFTNLCLRRDRHNNSLIFAHCYRRDSNEVTRR